MLCWFIYINCKQQILRLANGGEDAPFGYDFSQGYTSLEGLPAAGPPRKRPEAAQLVPAAGDSSGPPAKPSREHDLPREAEERRMDELLEKVQRDGIQSLTDEEKRFLTRVSARYRDNRKS